MSGTQGIVGRDQEQKTLEKAFKSNQAEFLAIYGRRRVGKTFLVRQYFTVNKNIASKRTFFST